MRQYALPMSATACARIPELLAAGGVTVEPHHDLGEFKVLRCRRGKAVVLLSVTRPVHWAAATDARRDALVVATVRGSLFRFWMIPAENRLRRDIIALLRPHGLAWATRRSK